MAARKGESEGRQSDYGRDLALAVLKTVPAHQNPVLGKCLFLYNLFTHSVISDFNIVGIDTKEVWNFDILKYYFGEV